MLTEPPRTISLSAGESHSKVALGAPTVGFADSIEDWLPALELRAEAISAHARWDPADSSDILTWLTKAAALEGGAGIMEARLAENPREVVTLRVQQDTAKGERHGEVCQRQMTQARMASDDPDLQYLAARCGTSEAVRDRAYLEGWRRWPRNAWFGYAAGYALADEGAYGEALAALEVVWRHAPPLADGAALLSARIRKMLARSESRTLATFSHFPLGLESITKSK